MRRLISLLKELIFGAKLRHSIEKNKHAAAELDVVVREVLQK
ncbi:hypothetical protein O2N63_07620 [Aliiroseovarius sp. KMU-50]|uniref:Uncharacterized protein n=1 Tax=Aliiroseovarius salicola TaxID=3009082 RepID=A0ABT4W0C6_9RHOB|nr:hypothetical protein [Aliiroseovarius sp. KMU-50]MDA5093954.1 hypothetical protein [Aliiroseovarius sp. KMU-50]